RVQARRFAVKEPDHRPCRLLPSRALHLGREQQTAATEQCDELTPLHVRHGDFLPYAYQRRRLARALFRTSSLPQGCPQVLGTDLKCSESRRRATCPSITTQDSKLARVRWPCWGGLHSPRPSRLYVFRSRGRALFGDDDRRDLRVVLRPGLVFPINVVQMLAPVWQL